MAERIIFHADDYGANKEISQQILGCCKNGGALNSLSVLPNSPDLEGCMELLAPYRERLAISVHLNLAEGPSVADPRQIPWLVDRRGMFSISFLKVLLVGMHFFHHKTRHWYFRYGLPAIFVAQALFLGWLALRL